MIGVQSRKKTSGNGQMSRRAGYVLFILPALSVIVGVIVFPWVYTVWMSLQDWRIGFTSTFIGLQNFAKLSSETRFLESVPRTLAFTLLAVLLPVVLGIFAAEVFHQQFKGRGFLRSIFIMPMMTTPVAIALVWAMMFHPQIGVLNYLLRLVGLPPSQWVYAKETVIPALVLVETWQWTPLVMLIVLGGLASLPSEPYESAVIDGANQWDMFRYISLPLLMPFIMIAVILRTIDALKSFDIIYVITQGGPGTASETLNLYLYIQAFQFFNIGHASAIIIVFFVLIMLLAFVQVWARERLKWT